ncbi:MULTISPECIES: DEAD/DEAH box helicase [Rhodococcus]|uniref:DEAD/DEAH box helicase n=1 Tax=Rhodococcus TaxID=1827 RepID=UPI001E48B523|nr:MULTISPECIES: DEAD/DEAH box helicase [Rhodococcus]BDB60829.1 putative ATP-dependent DNA helicase HelY [Rhodococcus sp. RDE2]
MTGDPTPGPAGDDGTGTAPLVPTPQLAEFGTGLGFPLDPFQIEACRALENGHSVLVCAPTGAGKTVVGEFAVYLALQGGSKCFYTTPIKALSNQKYADLCARHGRDAVGLLTGDQSINSDAPVVVMTTEVLRNMIYASSTALIGLTHVVMDEVHFLADRFRGAVWEEVILHLPEDVRLASLSATVSNAEEFGDWMTTVRGDTTVVVDEVRPIPLHQHMMLGSRIYDLFDRRADTDTAPTRRGRDIVVNPELASAVRQRQSLSGMDRWGERGPRFRPPPRPEVIVRLDRDGLLPAITFVFSRAGCDAAVQQCLRSGLHLTDDTEAAEIRRIVDEHTRDLPRGDLEVLGYASWRTALERGIAAHHAGMLPAFRHTVEELFVRGLVQAVFATETLALGINMPARTVVLEKLVKFNGDTHAELTPGEYTQLTGRAGRRGIDVEGHAVVLWQPGIEPASVAGLASTRTFPLRSSFRPSYNMAVNLIDAVGVERSRALLEMSFAQFQADKSVVGLKRGIDRNETTLAQLRDQLGGEGSEILDYLRLRAELTDAERAHERRGKQDRRAAAVASLVTLRRGDIIAVPAGKHTGLAVVVLPDTDAGDPRPQVVTADAWSGRLSAGDFPTPATVLGTLRLPRHVDHRTGRGRRDIASALRSKGLVPPRRPKRSRSKGDTREIDALRRELKHHPARKHPDLDSLARAGERYHRLLRETQQQRRKASAATDSLARTFERIVALLTERGYLTQGDDPATTEAGERLARIYTESDLLVAECVRRRAWAGLSAAELAAVASAVIYESRTDEPVTVVGPTGPIRHALAETTRICDGLRADEIRHRLPPTREPDLGFVTAAYTWASTASLTEALVAAEAAGKELSPGDFVRWCRQLIDLLDQIRTCADDPELARTAGKAVGAVRRGVVAVDPTAE